MRRKKLSGNYLALFGVVDGTLHIVSQLGDLHVPESYLLYWAGLAFICLTSLKHALPGRQAVRQSGWCSVGFIQWGEVGSLEPAGAKCREEVCASVFPLPPQQTHLCYCPVPVTVSCYCMTAWTRVNIPLCINLGLRWT